MTGSAPYCSICDLMVDKEITWDDIVVPSAIENLDIVGANKIMLASDHVILDRLHDSRNWGNLPLKPERLLDPITNEEFEKIPAERLLDSRFSQMPRDKWDFCIIDTSPSMNLATRNALLISDWVLIPLELAPMAMDGTQFMIDSLEDLGRRNNRQIRLLGALATVVEMNNLLSVSLLAVLQEVFKDKLFNVKIRKAVKIKEASGFHKSAFEYAPKEMATYEYDRFVDEVLDRLRGSNVEMPKPRFAPQPPIPCPEKRNEPSNELKNKRKSKLKVVRNVSKKKPKEEAILRKGSNSLVNDMPTAKAEPTQESSQLPTLTV